MKKLYSVLLTIFILIICLQVALQGYSQKIATLEVLLPKPTYGLEIPVSIELNNITTLPDSIFCLYEVKGSVKSAVPFQIEQADRKILHWVVKATNASDNKLVYELSSSKSEQLQNVKVVSEDGKLIIKSDDKNLLQYYFKTIYPPVGIDTAFKRSGFIHPLWSPHGQVLTRIQAPDHYHHYGIWNPWTHVLFECDTVDFWNLNLKQGTVRFADIISTNNGSVFSQFEVLHKHIVFKKNEPEKAALNELQQVRVYKLQKELDAYVLDFYFQLNCATEKPVKLIKYRYAGLGWRTTEKWDNKNSEVLTSENLTRKNADGSKARWCIVQGAIDNEYAGVEMMSYPTNYNHPEPLRIWPENQNGRGDMFANFCPTKDKDWLLKPGQNYVLKYRFLVYNNKLSKEKAESAWFYYANPPKINIK
jgi:hypothetical protein